MRGARARGQNLLLLALTMLLVTLMVLVTLGVGYRVRENHELNDLADAAAYSSAVVNARAFNDIAILNRLQVSYWVSMTANESLISWTSYARALWNATYLTLNQVSNGWTLGAPVISDCDRVRADAEAAANTVRADFFAQIANGGWRPMDNAAGQETRRIQEMIASLRAETRGAPGDARPTPNDGMRDRLFQERQAQNLAKRILLQAGVTDVTVVPASGASWPLGGASGLSAREVGDFGLGLYTHCTATQSGLCLGSAAGNWSNAVISAAMGTRGNPFVLSRGVLPPLVQAEWSKVDSAYTSSITFAGGVPTGSGYFDDTMSHAGRDSGGADSRFAWGDDHGSLTTTVSYRNCTRTATAAVTSHVKTTELEDSAGLDDHRWSPGDPGGAGDPQPEVYHTVGSCSPLCPSVWVRQVNFNPNDREAEAYGQPKVQVVLVRDNRSNTRQRQPWKLDFRFGFSSVGSIFDNRGELLHAGSAGAGLDINSQTAVATGITYYHRKDQWLEYPNLLNPFWRATLVAANIDETYRTDMPRVLFRASEQWQNDAYQALVNSGFKGVH